MDIEWGVLGAGVGGEGVGCVGVDGQGVGSVGGDPRVALSEECFCPEIVLSHKVVSGLCYRQMDRFDSRGYIEENVGCMAVGSGGVIK